MAIVKTDNRATIDDFLPENKSRVLESTSLPSWVGADDPIVLKNLLGTLKSLYTELGINYNPRYGRKEEKTKLGSVKTTMPTNIGAELYLNIQGLTQNMPPRFNTVKQGVKERYTQLMTLKGTLNRIEKYASAIFSAIKTPFVGRYSRKNGGYRDGDNE